MSVHARCFQREVGGAVWERVRRVFMRGFVVVLKVRDGEEGNSGGTERRMKRLS